MGKNTLKIASGVFYYPHLPAEAHCKNIEQDEKAEESL